MRLQLSVLFLIGFVLIDARVHHIKLEQIDKTNKVANTDQFNKHTKSYRFERIHKTKCK